MCPLPYYLTILGFCYRYSFIHSFNLNLWQGQCFTHTGSNPTSITSGMYGLPEPQFPHLSTEE